MTTARSYARATRAVAAPTDAAEPEAKLSAEEVLALIERIVDHRVRRLRYNSRAIAWDGEDLRQELICHAFSCLASFDPKRGALPGFLAAVVHRHAKNLLRNSAAGRRDHGRTCSWAVRSAQGELVDRSAQIPDSAHERRIGSVLSDEDDFILDHDLAVMKSAMNEDELRLAELLGKRKLRKIAAMMGVPRTTLQYWVQRLRARFEDQSLQEFL